MAKNRRSALLEVVPGKSIGDISIGESSADLIKKGFHRDQSRIPQVFFDRMPLKVRLEQDRIVQIWFDATQLQKLKMGSIRFPKGTQSSSENIQKIFKNCGPIIKGAGGALLYCENDGLEFSFAKQTGQTNDIYETPNSFSVIAPGVARDARGGS